MAYRATRHLHVDGHAYGPGDTIDPGLDEDMIDELALLGAIELFSGADLAAGTSDGNVDQTPPPPPPPVVAGRPARGKQAATKTPPAA